VCENNRLSQWIAEENNGKIKIFAAGTNRQEENVIFETV
jgi:hypothetical protein